MRSLNPRHTVLRFLPVLAAAALAACGAGDNPLDPTAESSTPMATPPEAVAPGGSPADLVILSQNIAWISYRTGWTELYKMDRLGTQSTQLTTLKSTLQGVSWSWDNKRLATVRYRGIDAFHGHNDIWIINADGTNGHWARTQTFPYNLSDPSFSPDGKRIVMTVWVGTTKALGWIDLVTGNANLFWKAGGGAVLGWKPTYNKAGTKVLFSTGFTLDQINADGTNQVTRVKPGAWVDHGLYSNDGTKIVYEIGAFPNNIDICVKNFSAGTTKQLTFTSAVDRFASFSPDGSKIVFMSNRSGKDQIYTMDATTGGSVAQITHTSVEEWAPVWGH